MNEVEVCRLLAGGRGFAAGREHSGTNLSLARLQVERQIEQMVRFIKQEAEEKANEIRVSAEEVRAAQPASPPVRRSKKTQLLPHSERLVAAQEFNLEKLQLLEQEKTRVRKEYERREGQVEVKKKM